MSAAINCVARITAGSVDGSGALVP